MPPSLIAIERRPDPYRETLHAVVHARVRDLEAVEVAAAPPLEAAPPLLLRTTIVGRRDQLLALLRVPQRRMIDAQLSADRRAFAAFHLAAHHEQIAVDPCASLEHHVGVDRQHASGYVSRDGHRSVEHGDVSGYVAARSDVEPVGRAQRRRRVEQRHDFLRHVLRKLVARRDAVPLLRMGRHRQPDREEYEGQCAHGSQ